MDVNSQQKFNSLAKKYPWHYLKFSYKYGTHREMEEKIKKANKEKFDSLKEFVLDAPLNDEENILLNQFLNTFENIIEQNLTN